MLLQELWGPEYFTRFSLFTDGLVGAFALLAFFWVFTFFSLRGKEEDAAGKASEILIAPFVAAFFLFALGIHPFISGLLVVVVYFFSYRHALGVKPGEFTGFFLYVLAILLILAFVDEFSRFILAIIFLIVAFAAGEFRLRDSKKEKEEKGEKEEEKSE